MKGHDIKNIEVDSNSDFKSMKMTINVEDGHMFDVLMNNMYRDPIGSIIRELTSNCFDSHIEAGVEDAVIIELGDDDAGEFISFQDFGVGISPDRMEKVYKELGKSTNRLNEKAIGFYGLGSKSPFAYVEEGFYVDTIYNGILYNYLVHRGSTTPEIVLLTTEETDKHNGTTVKIYFKRNGDREEFEEKLEQQLRYFDNVYVKGSSHFNNDYKLHIGKNFKFRNDCQRVGLHLCIGKVTYPIDWEKLDMSKIDMPLALKFNIGDLPVTPERESIRYGQVKIGEDDYIDTRDIIKEKIKYFCEEIQDLIGREPVYHNNYFDWLEAQDQTGYIKLLGVDIKVPIKVAKPVEQLYQPLHSVGLKPSGTSFFYQFNIRRYLDPSHGSKMKNYIGKLRENLSTLSPTNFDNYLIVREFEAVGKFKQIKLDYLKYLARDTGKGGIYFIGKVTTKVGKYIDLPKKVDYSTGWNKMKLLKYYKELVLKELIANSISYDDLKIPQEFEEKWRAENNRPNKKVEANEDELVADDIRVLSKTNRRRSISLEEISNFEGFVMYGFEKDLPSLERFAELFRSGEFSKSHMILRIRQMDQKHIFLFKNTLHVERFMSDNPIFRKVAAATYINKSKIRDYNFYPTDTRNEYINNLDIYKLIFYPLADTVNSLLLKAKNTINLKSEDEDQQNFLDEIVKIAENNNWLEESVVKDVKKVETYFDGLELFNYIVPHVEAVPKIANFVKLCGKPVNKEWEVLQPWQMELMEEIQDKFIYLEELDESDENKVSITYTDLSSVKKRRIEKSRDKLKNLTIKARQSYKEVQIFKHYHDDRQIEVTNN